MCGIVGAVAQTDITPVLINGLKRLEYRGYDSAGVAMIDNSGEVRRRRALGKVSQLEHVLETNPAQGSIGIAHTRWATHGAPSVENAHPHMSGDRLAIVHNGIIENHAELRNELESDGFIFESDTDTEVLAHLIKRAWNRKGSLLGAVRSILGQLEGAYALGIIKASEPDRIIAARHGSPLVIGKGENGSFLASDQLALLSVTDQFIYLEEGDLIELKADELSIWDKDNSLVEREVHTFSGHSAQADKGEYRHYMLKEIHEQAQVMADALEGRLSNNRVLEAAFGVQAPALFNQAEHIQIIACGTSYHAGMVARYWLEELAGIACSVEIASEYRYRKAVIPANTLLVTVSQSGETADTLAAMRSIRNQTNCIGTLAVCNVPGSSLVRESDLSLMTHAGPEIGVASTKAFTSQLVGFLLLTVVLGRRHGLSAQAENQLVAELKRLPSYIRHMLELDDEIAAKARLFHNKQHALFLGRGAMYPIAMEGALKLKEISYIHAEAYAAGELKHGPLALVDEKMPVVAVVPNDELLEKTLSNLQEVKARNGELFLFAAMGTNLVGLQAREVINIPVAHPWIAPLVYTVPLQLLSYHVALLKGTDVDQPRNLAKAVTVE
ncbi:glutamine--fructose-6-phosphate transaminase (isomerizing) [Endozoicomonadaceae bacterium StTr2]